MNIGMNICYTTKQELKELKDSLKPFKKWINFITPMKVVLKGDALKEQKVADQQKYIESVEDLEKVTRSCLAGHLFLSKDMDNFAVAACGWGPETKAYPLYFVANPESLAAAFRELEKNPVFQAIRKNGFIDSLSPHGKELVVAATKGKPCMTECDLCMLAQAQQRTDIWDQCTAIKEGS